MRRQPFSRPYLIVPAKSSGAVGGELHVVGWISVYEVFWFDREIIKIATGKYPVLENALES